MSDDINERIARLVEPEPVFLRGTHKLIPYPSVGDVWIRDCDDFLGPRQLTDSVDASLAVIERRWPKVGVHLERRGLKESERIAWVDFRGYHGPRIQGLGPTAAHALALALLASLEAEAKS